MISTTAIMDLTTDMEDGPAAHPASSGEADVFLGRARAGDTTAFEDLIRRQERLVFGTARQVLGTRDDAEDAAQEVFLRLFHHLGRLDPTRPLGAWLYRVTVNVCRTLRRRRRARPATVLGDAVESLTAEGSGPPATLELEEERRMIHVGLTTLGKRERTTLTLHDIEGLSTREVAEALGISEGTVRTHLCRGRPAISGIAATRSPRPSFSMPLATPAPGSAQRSVKAARSPSVSTRSR